MQTQTYSANNLILNKDILTVYINNFWNDTFSKIKDGNYLMIMIKVSFTESTEGIKSLAHLRSVNFKDKEVFINYISDRLGILNDSYQVLPVNQIIFNYVIKKGKASYSLKVRWLVQDTDDNILNSHRFNNMNLPLSMNPEDYGTITLDNYVQVNGKSYHRFLIENGTKFFQIDRLLIQGEDSLIVGATNIVKMLGAIDLSWTDKLMQDGIVQREIGKAFIYFVDGQIVVRQKVLNSKPFGTIKSEKVLKHNFVTMDMETIRKQNGNLIPYLISAYNGTEYITSYATINQGKLDQQELVTSFINKLATFFPRKSTNLTVYAHNLSAFDGIFLVRNMLPLGSVQPLIYNGKLISIRLRLPKGKTIIFKDSLLLLPNSLRQLCIAFNVLEQKSNFPFSLRNIFYKGVFPAYKLWSGITLEQYLEMKSEFKLLGVKWNFKDESIKYCNLDCKCLYDILIKFNELIFSHFNINIHSVLTLPSLSMRIYKSKFMPENTIYQLTPNVDREIRQAYTGGAVDVYLPHNRAGNAFDKLFYYDINSLYPFIMAKTPMPVGKPKAFKGDIRAVNPEAFGYFYCEITSPSDIAHPIIQQRIKTVGGIRTVAGTGGWTGWIFSSELDNAANHKYQFKIIKGYEFEKGYIFKDYIETLYALRMQYDKDDPMNYVAKLLMNSLYGKFGMKTQSTKVDIYNILNEVELKVFNEMVDTEGPAIQDWLQIDNHFIVIRDNIPNPYHNEDNDHYHGLDVNVSIAAAITAGGENVDVNT